MIFERKKYLDELIAGRETRGLFLFLGQCQFTPDVTVDS